MQIRNPEYIEKAIKQKQIQNDAKKNKVASKRKLNDDEKTPEEIEESRQATSNEDAQKINKKKRGIDDKENLIDRKKDLSETNDYLKDKSIRMF